MKRFLIINPFGIGDVLFTTPLIKTLKGAYPDSVIGYWCNGRVRDILKNNSSINTIFALSRGDLKKIYHKSRWEGIYRFWNLWHKLKKARFNLCFDFSLDHRYSLVAKLSGIKKRIGFNYKKRGRFLTHKIEIDGYNHKHIVEYYSDLLKFIDLEPKINNLDLSVPQNNRIKAKQLLSKAGINEQDLIVGIAPGAGASWGKDARLKHWPAIKFAQLADRIIENFGVKIIILGDVSERPIADIIVNTMHHQAIDLTGKTNLEDLVAIIDNLALLITNDGGPLHIAVALGKKTISFFGPVDPKVYGPYPPNERLHIVLKRNLECSPCYRNFRLSGCLRNRECLEEIDLGQALDAVSKLLSKEEIFRQ